MSLSAKNVDAAMAAAKMFCKQEGLPSPDSWKHVNHRIASDCSGVETVFLAAQGLHVPCEHVSLGQIAVQLPNVVTKLT